MVVVRLLSRPQCLEQSEPARPMVSGTLFQLSFLHAILLLVSAPSCLLLSLSGMPFLLTSPLLNLFLASCVVWISSLLVTCFLLVCLSLLCGLHISVAFSPLSLSLSLFLSLSLSLSLPLSFLSSPLSLQ